jgi:hypothetical protein
VTKPRKSLTRKEFEALDTLGFPGARELQARYAASLDEAEAEFGPEVPSLKRGRPGKDEDVEPVQAKSVKMPPAFWIAMERKAKQAGLSLHAAMRAALFEWASKH